jgi:hypothetical protein
MAVTTAIEHPAPDPTTASLPVTQHGGGHAAPPARTAVLLAYRLVRVIGRMAADLWPSNMVAVAWASVMLGTLLFIAADDSEHLPARSLEVDEGCGRMNDALCPEC